MTSLVLLLPLYPTYWFNKSGVYFLADGQPTFDEDHYVDAHVEINASLRVFVAAVAAFGAVVCVCLAVYVRRFWKLKYVLPRVSCLLF